MTKREEIDRYADMYEQEIYLLDGFDEAIVGLVTRINFVAVCYSAAKIVEVLQRDMSYEDAREFFLFNVAGSYMGETSPVFLEDLEEC